MERIGQLYAIEEQIRGRPPDERRKVRQERSRSLLDFFAGLAGSHFAEAIPALRYRRGGTLRTRSLEGFEPLLRRRPDRGR